MFRSRLVHGATVLAASLTLATAVVVTSFSHEDDAPRSGPEACTEPEPEPGRPIAMPAGLVGLEIALGLKDGQPTEWEGDVKVSKGRVVAVAIERSGPN